MTRRDMLQSIGASMLLRPALGQVINARHRVAAQTYDQLILSESSLVSYWRMGESSGNFADSKSANTAVASGTITYAQTGTVAGSSNKSATFNGSSGLATIAATGAPFDLPNMTTAFSVEAWISPADLTGDYVFYSKENSGSPFQGFRIGMENLGRIYFFFGNFGSSYCAGNTADNSIKSDGFQHIVFTYDGSGATSGIKIYINSLSMSVSFSSSGFSGNPSTTANPIIGGGLSRWFNGGLDEVAFYSAALTQTQVRQHFQSALLPASTGTPAVILDTDIGWDRDDLSDVYATIWLHKNGYINLKAMISATQIDYAAALLQEMATYTGVSPTIAAFKGSAGKSEDAYAHDTAIHYNGTLVNRASWPTSSLTAYRTILANNSNVVILSIGTLDAIAELVASPADGISGLTGSQLIAAKCSKWICVAGQYPSGSEYDFTDSPAGAAAAVSGWPTSVPIYFVNYAQGNTVTAGSDMTTYLPSNNILRYGNQTGGGYGRPSWGTMGVLQAASVGGNYFTVAGANGTNTVNSSTGANSWASTPNNNHNYMANVYPDALYRGLFNYILYTDITP